MADIPFVDGMAKYSHVYCHVYHAAFSFERRRESQRMGKLGQMEILHRSIRFQYGLVSCTWIPMAWFELLQYWNLGEA